MSQYIKQVSFSTQFDGDTVVCKLGAIRQEHSLQLYALKRDEKGKIAGEDLTKFYSTVLPVYAKDFAGLKDADGIAVTLQEACEQSYFVGLVMEMGSALLKTGKVRDPKVPASQPTEPSTA